jgi:hypothetical protein
MVRYFTIRQGGGNACINSSWKSRRLRSRRGMELHRTVIRMREERGKQAARAALVLFVKLSLRGAGEGLLHFYQGNYASFTTLTVTSAMTSLCNLTGTLCSPRVLIGSSNWILRRSMVKLRAAKASATSFEVTEPKS